MPIDFSPPSGSLQGYQISSPQSTDPLQTLAQMGQLRTQNLQRQGLEQENEIQRQSLDSAKALMQIMTETKPGETFQQTYQRAAATGKILPAHLKQIADAGIEYQKGLDVLDENKRKRMAAGISTIRPLYAGVTDQTSLDAANQSAVERGVPQELLFKQPYTDAAHLTAHVGSLIPVEQAIKETQEKAATEASQAAVGQAQATTAETQLKTKQLQSQLDWLDNLTPKGLADYVGESIDKTKYPDLYARAYNAASQARAMRKPELLQAAIDKYATIASEQEKTISTETNPQVRQARVDQAVATARATAPIKIDVAAATAGARADAAGLTDDDYNRAGEQYMRTGVMPGVGRDSITRGRIVKAGNQWARDNGLSPSDVITMQAAYAGDKDSLKKFQAQRDQIVSFEQTAQKNLDLFLSLAEKIPDTGIPWLNRPLRSLDQSVVGSENMAAVNAARQIANNEIAKVTSGGGLGGVLSDSARHEVAGYNPDNATFAQTKAVANILKQDMANRHGSMDATLSDIKARIGGTTKPEAQPGNAPGAAPAKRHFLNNREIIPKGGVWVYKDTGQEAK